MTLAPCLCHCISHLDLHHENNILPHGEGEIGVDHKRGVLSLQFLHPVVMRPHSFGVPACKADAPNASISSTNTLPSKSHVVPRDTPMTSSRVIHRTCKGAWQRSAAIRGLHFSATSPPPFPWTMIIIVNNSICSSRAGVWLFTLDCSSTKVDHDTPSHSCPQTAHSQRHQLLDWTLLVPRVVSSQYCLRALYLFHP